MVAQTVAMFQRLHSAGPGVSPEDALDHFEPGSAAPPPRLVAERVDLPSAAATCEPARLVGPKLGALLQDLDGIFPSFNVGVGEHRAPRGQRSEYAKVIGKMLAVGKMGLCSNPRGVGAFFVVAKADPGHLRPIWHGGVVSEHCSPPPAPRRLGNLASFLELVLGPGETRYISKRDAASFFDVLKAPVGTHQWFCCPPLRADEIAAGLGVSMEDLRAHLLDDACADLTARTMLHPASLAWPMGFAWSSAVAQDVTLGLLDRAGLPEESILCDSEEAPADDEESAIVATDDTIFFHRDPAVARARLAAFDEAMEVARVPRAIKKDIDLANSITGLGCELTVVPAAASPDRNKLLSIFLATLGLDTRGRASPKAVHSLLGIDQWFCLLSRPHSSCFRDT